MSTPSSASKRLSLNISTNPGHRPLHLVDRNVPAQLLHQEPAIPSSSNSPTSESSTPSSSTNATKNVNRPRPRPVCRQSSISYYATDADTVTSLPGPRHALTRSASVGYSPRSAVPKTGDRESTGSITGDAEKERQPHTLADKHAELLHFIAQKESICLELRSQLAIHEAELLQLKQKWERIVNRGFNRTNVQNDSVSYVTVINGQGSSAMLEGIKEGVQGVGRFFAAGLGEFSSPTSPTSPSSSRYPQQGHVARQSNSSISTYATQSTRLSQSSASSLGDDPHPAPKSPLKDEETQDQDQVLMVHDTGATPTMSPNFRFVHQQQQQQAKAQQDNARLNPRPESGAYTKEESARLHREVAESVSPKSDVSPTSPARLPSTDSGSVKQKNRANRASMYGNMSGLPPASSIPGLGSLAIGVGAAAPSWVGSVGKRWEELQKGSTFSKSQKRASVILSDVSQTIVSALSSPSLASSHNAMLPTPPPSSSVSRPQCLLDDENPSDGITFVMKPDSAITLPANGMSPQGSDDEWNW